MTNLVRAARSILLAVGELPPNKKLIHAAFALQDALFEQADGEQWSPDDMAYRPSGLSMEQAEQEPVGIVWDASAPVVMDSSSPKNKNKEVADLRKQVAALKAVIDAWNNVEQEPVAEVVLRSCKVGFGRTEERKDIVFLTNVEAGTKLYSTPVRTKDLTDAELNNLWIGSTKGGWLGLFRAVIAADREKNRG